VTVLVNDDASGQATHSAFAQFPNFVDAPATLTDYAPVMAEIKASDRKAIVNNQSGANAGYARKAEIAAGLDIPFLAGPQVLTSSFANIVGSDAAGVDVLALRPMLSEQPPGTDPKQAAAIAAYRDAFQSYTNRDPSLESAGPINVWDAALSFGYAAAGLKDVTRDSLQKQMIGQEYMGAGGYVKRTAADHNGFQQDSWVYASLTKDGKVKAVAEMRDGKPTLVK
jgi:ABC-type branched-subunit amino acid transport system substrate-binding protein